MQGETLNSIGLMADIVGAVMLWYFVVEIRLVDIASYRKGHARLELIDPSPEDVRAYARAVLLSRVGIVLIVLGFVLQLVGNVID